MSEPLRVYVAGASKEPERVRAAMEVVQRCGMVITCDWLAAIEAAGAANEGLTDAQRVVASHVDLQGVASADVVWVLAPTVASAGCWVELGYALGLRHKRRAPMGLPGLVVSGPARTRCVFAVTADYETDLDLDAAGYLLGLRASREAA